MNNRRKFLGSVAAIGLVGLAGQSVSTSIGQAQETGKKKQEKPNAKTESKKPERPKKLDSKLVGMFVGRSHGDLKSIKEMVAKEPLLVHASWDWAGGDWESGLNAASHVGNRPIAEYLLEKGARLDVCAAVMLGMKGIVKEMLIVNPKLHTVRGAHTITLLSHAIYGKEKADDVLSILIEAGADLNATTKAKSTALMSAVGVGRAEIVEMLIDKGADPSLKNSQDMTALDIAVKREKADVVKLLKSHSK